MPITIYGIKNCDTIKKARAWLETRGVAYAFHDYKTAGLDRQQLEAWTRDVGWEPLVNRAGTTFRKLPDADKANLNEAKALALMLANPSLVKRPVLDLGRDRLLVGFKPELYEKSVGLSFGGAAPRTRAGAPREAAATKSRKARMRATRLRSGCVSSQSDDAMASIGGESRLRRGSGSASVAGQGDDTDAFAGEGAGRDQRVSRARQFARAGFLPPSSGRSRGAPSSRRSRSNSRSPAIADRRPENRVRRRGAVARPASRRPTRFSGASVAGRKARCRRRAWSMTGRRWRRPVRW